MRRLRLACKPALPLVNIELHGRHDGIGLARELKLMGIPVLFISDQEEKARAVKAVAIGSLAKPYHADHMIEAGRYLRRHVAGDESLPRPAGLGSGRLLLKLSEPRQRAADISSRDRMLGPSFAGARRQRDDQPD